MANEAVTVFIPKEAVNDLAVRLSAWRAADKEKVEAGRVIAEIETSKAVLELRAPAAGFLRRSLPEGSDVPVGGPLCFITAWARGSSARRTCWPSWARARTAPTWPPEWAPSR